MIGECHPSYIPELDSVVDELIACVGVSSTSIKQRIAVFNYARECINSALTLCDYSVRVAMFGSVPLRSCIWDADVDIAVIARSRTGLILPDGPSDDLLNDIHAYFVKLQSEGSSTHLISGIQLIPSRVPVLKVSMGSFVLDISVNKLAGTVKLPFLDMVDSIVSKGHLFKRSLLLIKAWCTHESRLLGSSKGLLATYAVEVMLICLFSLFHDQLNRPLGVFLKFLEFYSQFDWENSCVTACGPLPKDRLRLLLSECGSSTINPRVEVEAASGRVLKVRGLSGSGWVADFRTTFCYDHNFGTPFFQMKNLNIVDPLCHTNNLGRSVSPQCFARFVGALQLGLRNLRNACKNKSPEALRQMFHVSFSRGEVPVTSAICFEPVKKLIKRDPSISVAGFAAHGYSVLRADIDELIWTYLSAHPDYRNLDPQGFANFLWEQRRAGSTSRGRSVETVENRKAPLLRHVITRMRPIGSASSTRSMPLRARAFSGSSSEPDRFQ